VLRDSPGYYWGLSELAEWYAHEKRFDDYLRLSERMVAAAPSQAISYGHRGAARMQAGDRQGAKADWQLALRLEPTYTYAALALTDAQLEDRQLDDAAGTIKSIRQHAPSDFILAREMRLACALDDRGRGENVLSELCQWKHGNQWPIRTAADEMAKTFGLTAVLAVLQKSFYRGDANPEGAALLVEGYARGGRFWKCRRVLRKVRSAPEAWRRGAAAYLRLAAEKKQRMLVYWFVRQNHSALRAQTWTWGSVAEALSKSGLRRQVLKWCADWRQRQEVTPNMLFYYTLGLRHRFRFDRATEVHRFALTLPPDGAEHVHRLMLLIDDFAAQMLPHDAKARLAEIDPERLSDFYRDVWQLAKGWIQVMSPPELATLGHFAAVNRLKLCLGKSCDSFLRIRPFQLIWNKLLAQLASSRGRPVLTCWYNIVARCARWI